MNLEGLKIIFCDLVVMPWTRVGRIDKVQRKEMTQIEELGCLCLLLVKMMENLMFWEM
jgi:hypothetical protein